MNKTRFGIAVGLVGAALYFLGLYCGYTVTLLLAAYVLYFESDMWLKKCAVKTVALMVSFSLLSTLIYLLPDALRVLQSLVSLFGGYFSFDGLSNLAGFLTTVLEFIRKIMFIGLGIRALSQGNITVPVVDRIIDRNML